MTARSGTSPMGAGLADTSLFIAVEQARPLGDTPPEHIAVSVITVAELRLGVLAATDGATRARRLDTLSRAEALDPLPVDKPVAHAWAALRLALRDKGKRMPLNDSWIAATALANSLAVVTQDDDYDEVPGLQVIRV
jgi:predicted nucleic acid-binding protein